MVAIDDRPRPPVRGEVTETLSTPPSENLHHIQTDSFHLGGSPKNESIAINASSEDLGLMATSWPENFSSLFEMGQRSMERLFNHRPFLKGYFGLPEDDETWRKDDRIKKIVLTLEQTLAQAVATFGEHEPDPTNYAPPDPNNTPLHFAETMQEIGGLHRAIVPSISPDNFELLFKLLPEVIADVVSSCRKEGPLPPADRQRLLRVWASVAVLMARHFVLGWERRIVPKIPKFNKAYRSEQGAAQQPKRSFERKPNPFGRNTFTTAGRGGQHQAGGASTARDRTNRGGSQDEVVMSSWQLQRGHSAPINLLDLDLEVGSPPT